MNDTTAQMIIDAIQRDEVDETIEKYIREADNYLLKGGEKPSFYNEFIEITLRDLKTTINGCIKSRNNEKQKDDLKKYKEGYFNEIVQNANDIVWTAKGKENPEMTIQVCKEANHTYKVSCTYPDQGFRLENIYGFCTRGNSDKKSENGQEGMYGIGIKSLLCFVDKLEINSNISIICKSKEGKLLGDVEIEPNEEWERNQTTLSFQFIYDAEKKNQKHAGFNTGKLARLIDEVYNEGEISRFDRFFFDGKDEEMVFDARSLFFTELRGKNRTPKNSIKCIKLQKENDSQHVFDVLEIKSEETPVRLPEATSWEKPLPKIKTAAIKDHYQYLIFHYEAEQISIAFEYNQKKHENELQDRLYATYFIGTYGNKTPLLGRKTGCLVNTVAINSSRSGLERENEKEPKILDSIMQKGKKCVELLCLLSTMDAADGPQGGQVLYLDVLCHLLWIYRNEFIINESGDRIPLYIFENNLNNVEESIKNWTFYVEESIKNRTFYHRFKFILKEKEEDGIAGEKITFHQPVNSDERNIEDLFRIYQTYITPGIEKDMVIYRSEKYELFTSGIKNLSGAIFDDQPVNSNKLWLIQISKLPFLDGVKDAIERRIGGCNFHEIQQYLSEKVDKGDWVLMKQLIARYEVNKCFDYMGQYSDEYIKTWLFLKSDDPEYNENDMAYNEKVKEFKRIYGSLKQCIQPMIEEIEYYSSPCWRASSDYWYRKKEAAESSELTKISICDEIMIQLLKLIRSPYVSVGKMYDDSCLFVHNHPWDKEIILRNRHRTTTCWDGTFQSFSINHFNTKFSAFDKFKIARAYVDEYNKNAKDKFKISYFNQCDIPKIKLSEMSQIFEWMATYQNMKEIKINIRKLDFEEQASSQSVLIRFVKKLIEKDIREEIFLKTDIFSVNNGSKKFIGFATNLTEENQIYVKQSSKSDFIQIAKIEHENQIGEIEHVPEKEKKFLLIYSSYNDEQSVLSEVLKKIGTLTQKDWTDICAYTKSFITTGNTSLISSEMYSRFLKRSRLTYVYPFQDHELSQYEEQEGQSLDLTMKQTLDFLAGEMSYDHHCPICNSISALDLEQESINQLEQNSFLVAMLEASYQRETEEKNIYIKILCCKNCFKEYKNSLTKAVIKDEPGKAYKKLILKNTISTLAMSRDIEKEVLISPDNWKLICQFNQLPDEASITSTAAVSFTA